MSDQTFGSCGLAELTREVNYPSNIFGVFHKPHGLPRWCSGKASICSAGDPDLILGKWQPTPVFLPQKSHGQRHPAGYSPWGCRVRHHLVTKQQNNVSLVVKAFL